MAVTLRSIQIYEPAQEAAFLELEERFAQLERSRADLPKGRRLRMVAGGAPGHTLVWECEFPDLAGGWAAFTRYCNDPEHVALADQQRPYLRQSNLEILERI
jgi:hypothetical protein